jgi:hypothetical protein
MAGDFLRQAFESIDNSEKESKYLQKSLYDLPFEFSAASNDAVAQV